MLAICGDAETARATVCKAAFAKRIAELPLRSNDMHAARFKPTKNSFISSSFSVIAMVRL